MNKAELLWERACNNVCFKVGKRVFQDLAIDLDSTMRNAVTPRAFKPGDLDAYYTICPPDIHRCRWVMQEKWQ